MKAPTDKNKQQGASLLRIVNAGYELAERLNERESRLAARLVSGEALEIRDKVLGLKLRQVALSVEAAEKLGEARVGKRHRRQVRAKAQTILRRLAGHCGVRLKKVVKILTEKISCFSRGGIGPFTRSKRGQGNTEKRVDSGLRRVGALAERSAVLCESAARIEWMRQELSSLAKNGSGVWIYEI
ncbi:MAG: hypothetical protein NVV63_02325 [Opitutus sp.]|nr:hypothetical protein [Opitutus sp.]